MNAARTAWIRIERVALWLTLPLLLWVDVLPVVYWTAILAAAAAYALSVALFERARWDELGFDGLSGFRPSLALGMPWVAASVPALALFTVALHGRSAASGLPTPDGESLAGLFLFYACVSVTSQEFLYSSFFFWRYRPLFSPGSLLGLNSLAFGLAHIVFDSWVSVGLAVAGRIVLAREYQRHGSFWGVWALHVVFGVATFVAGLGRYFYRPGG